MASSVARGIEPKLLLAEIARAGRKPTDSLDASDLYLRALAQYQKFAETSTDTAISLAVEALVLDPSYAPAAGLIGWCRLIQAVQGWGSLSSDRIADAVRLAAQAIETGRMIRTRCGWPPSPIDGMRKAGLPE